MKAIGFLASPLLSLLGAFKGPKSPFPQRPVTQDTARDAALRRDELLRRRGGAADVVTGSLGAEAGPGATGKTTLGS